MRGSKSSGVTVSPVPSTSARPPTTLKGTSDPSARATSRSVQPAQRSTAAASVDPPPSPPPRGIRLRTCTAARRPTASRARVMRLSALVAQRLGAGARLGDEGQPGTALGEGELVRQAQADHFAPELVVPVRPDPGHGQGKGELGGSEEPGHRANLPHSSTVSSSARASGRMPARAKASGATTPASELRNILRRCPKPAFTTAARRS